MLTANLLPPQEKALVRQEEVRRLILFFATIVTAVFVSGAVLLAPSYLPLLLEKREIERALALERGTSERLGVPAALLKIQKVRSTLSFVRVLTPESKRASVIMARLFEDAGANVTVTTLNVKKTGEIIFTGSAKTRRDLLDFERALRESGRFQEISSPLSNIIREVDVVFTIQGKLKPNHSL